MYIRKKLDFNNCEFWSGGKITYERIKNAGKIDKLESLCSEAFSDVIPTLTEVNDFLWFESDFIYDSLGISNEDGSETYNENKSSLVKAFFEQNKSI